MHTHMLPLCFGIASQIAGPAMSSSSSWFTPSWGDNPVYFPYWILTAFPAFDETFGAFSIEIWSNLGQALQMTCCADGKAHSGIGICWHRSQGSYVLGIDHTESVLCNWASFRVSSAHHPQCSEKTVHWSFHARSTWGEPLGCHYSENHSCCVMAVLNIAECCTACQCPRTFNDIDLYELLRYVPYGENTCNLLQANLCPWN